MTAALADEHPGEDEQAPTAPCARTARSGGGRLAGCVDDGRMFGVEGIHTHFQGSARSSKPATSALARSTAPYMLA